MNVPGACIRIGNRTVGPGHPTFIIAEMSANHLQDERRAIEIIHAIKGAGADAVKIQTYTADTMTIRCERSEFQIGKGTIWEGKSLYDLYEEASTPWSWQSRLKSEADSLGLMFFSTPFDETAVDFLETLDVPAYKIASFEIADLSLIRKAAQTKKPLIVSTGMSAFQEIQEALDTARDAGAAGVALLKCTSAYPAPPSEMNLSTITDLARKTGVPVGLSDHTLGIEAPIAAVALGACIIEKHFTISRKEPGPDSAFSLEASEFKAMVDAVRVTEQALGRVFYGATQAEEASRVFRRSLFVVANMKAGEPFNEKNIRAIRPGNGLPPKHLSEIVGKKATRPIERGTPLSWALVE